MDNKSSGQNKTTLGGEQVSLQFQKRNAYAQDLTKK